MVQEDFVCGAGDCPLNNPRWRFERASLAKERTRSNRIIEVFDSCDRAQIETDEDRLILQTILLHCRHGCACKLFVSLYRTPTLQFNIDDKALGRAISQQAEYFFERGNGLPRVFQTRQIRMPPVEPASDISLFERGQLHASDQALTQTRPWEHRIMNHNRYAVT